MENSSRPTKSANETVFDLSHVADIDEKRISDILQSRFLDYNIYTDIGFNNLIAINPFKEFVQNDAQTSEEYVTSYKRSSMENNSITKLNPHVFELANRAYFHMRRTGNDQAIFLNGESGSGKTETKDLIIRHLVRLGHNKKKSKIQTQLINGQKVLEAFGSAQTTYNGTSASRYGLYTELHFNERGKMMGAKTLHYFLEKTRVCSGKGSEGNFNVFYWLLAGTTPDEKQVLQLTDDLNTYHYLSNYGRPILPQDKDNFNELKEIMRSAGLRREHFSRVIQLLSAILHLGNISFEDQPGIGTEESVMIKNEETLGFVADFLGLDATALKESLTFKTAMIGKDVTTLILDAQQATAQRDELAQTLYSLLFSWLVERINQKTFTEQFNSFIGLLDFPGTQTTGFGSVGFDRFCVNYANERIFNFFTTRTFQQDMDEFQAELIQVPQVPYTGNSPCIELLERPNRGICAIYNKMAEKTMSGKKMYTDLDALDAIVKYNNENPNLIVKASTTGARQFAIQHYPGEVTYDPTEFISKNNNQLLVDFISLFRGGPDSSASWNNFVLDLFSDENLSITSHPLGGISALMDAKKSEKPTRLPSMRKSKRLDPTSPDAEKEIIQDKTGKHTVLAQIQSALDDLLNSLQEATLWSVFCLRSNATESPVQFDSHVVQSQIKAFNLLHLANQMKHFYLSSLPLDKFLSRYAVPLSSMGLEHSGTAVEQCESVKRLNNWSEEDMAIGTTKVFLSYKSWHLLEDNLRTLEKQEQKSVKMTDTKSGLPAILGTEDGLGLQTRGVDEDDTNTIAGGHPLPSVSAYSETGRSYYSQGGNHHPAPHQRYMGDNQSFYGAGQTQSEYTESNYNSPPVVDMIPPPQEDLNATEERASSMTPGRKRWLILVWAITFWIPSFLLIKLGRMKRKDVRLAWREKVALCAIITFMCAFVIGFLVFFGEIICPHQSVFSVNELSQRSEADNGYVAIRGEVFDLSDYASHHRPNVVSQDSVLEYAGTDVTDLFPVQVSDLCANVSPYVSLDYNQNYTDKNAQYHDFRYASGSYRKDWYYKQMSYFRKNYKVGHMGIEPKGLQDQAKGSYELNGVKMNRIWAVIDEHIYDLTTYILGGRFLTAPEGETITGDVDTNFLDSRLVTLFQQHSGEDITELVNALPYTDAERQREMACIRNLYFSGLVDNRNSTKCQFSTYFLLVVTVCLCLVIFAKFVAALRIGSPRVPEESEKFVICQVTCYTEDEESLRKTIDSLASVRYDDKRKLILVICDGMVIGSGNDRPTSRIVLDIFGVDSYVDPEPLPFISVGEGMKQYNRAKLYSGLYDVNGHVVPYLVVSKVGGPNERQKPGNRGKRDSQLILMQFLNRLQYDAPMNPMQLEMYHQMKNIIGISPEKYDFVLMVDADTEVMKEGLNHLVSSMSHDAKVIGLCGETTIANEKDTWVTMIQVYEYFISHHMIKSFESLFSTVSCLPGCFTMYRIRTIDGKRPLFVSNEIIEDYTINVVDTLHKKNLLYLGEDRYLTTLLLKHFPEFKTKFNPLAQCKTNAPDTWDVLISQRRRWINSTVHNLSELVFLNRLCGFCCFSMRFVVMLDLFSTLVQPALLGYLGYLIYTLTKATDQVPYITIITLGCTYGLQIIIFIMNKRWEYIVWFLVSILALPIFSFWIPVYSYWHFDDFSWGNTRVVVGEKGKKMAVADEGEFDPKSIPLMPWSEYERMLTAESVSDGLSQSTYPPAPRSQYGGGGGAYSVAGTQSNYGGYSSPFGAPAFPAGQQSVYGGGQSVYGGGGGQSVYGGGGGQSVYGGGQSVYGGGGGHSVYGGGQSIAGGQSFMGDRFNSRESLGGRQTPAGGRRTGYGPTLMNEAMADNMNAPMVNSYYSQNRQNNT